MTSSSTAAIATSPSFRKDDVIPDSYFSNLAIFFIVLISVGLVAARFFKKYIIVKTKSDKSNSSISKQTTQLSPATKLHIVEYEKIKIIIVESSNRVSTQILHESNAISSSNNQLYAVQNPKAGGEL